jgi:XTP/dITP diphosphohydrolase
VLKALGYAKQTGLVALADDSGLEVDLLDGRPGVFSARFGGEHLPDADRVQLLLQEISKHETGERTARFVCCMALAGWDSENPTGNAVAQVLTVTEATCEGSIALEPRGSNGFGFDPVFVPAGFETTFGTLPAQIKNEISHRAQALAAIRLFLQRGLAQT